MSGAALDPLALDAVVEGALAKLRRQLFERGITGTNGLARAFKTADFNGNKKLDPEEFTEALQFAGLFLPKPEVSALFRKFDRTHDGSVDYDEFLRGVKVRKGCAAVVPTGSRVPLPGVRAPPTPFTAPC